MLCSCRYVNEADCIRISIYWRLESNFVAFNNITCPLDIGINLVTISDARLGIDPERSVILDLRSCTSQWLLYISMRQNTRVQSVCVYVVYVCLKYKRLTIYFIALRACTVFVFRLYIDTYITTCTISNLQRVYRGRCLINFLCVYAFSLLI